MKFFNIHYQWSSLCDAIQLKEESVIKQDWVKTRIRKAIQFYARDINYDAIIF